MGKSSSKKNLQKIHTYAQDIESVRGSKQNSSDTVPTSAQKTEPVTVEKTFTPAPTTKKKDEVKIEESTDLLVPQKPNLPAIRTMISDKKNITDTKQAAQKSESKPLESLVKKPIEIPSNLNVKKDEQ